MLNADEAGTVEAIGAVGSGGGGRPAAAKDAVMVACMPGHTPLLLSPPGRAAPLARLLPVHLAEVLCSVDVGCSDEREVT